VGQRRDGAKPKEACEHLTVAGDRYVMNSFCKNHDCEANSAVLLYSPEKKVVYGAVYEKGKSTRSARHRRRRAGQAVEGGMAHAGEVAALGGDNRAMDDAASAPPLPDRLSVDPRSPHHVAAVFERGVGIRLNGKERFDVEEYCLSEGWIKVPAGKTLDRKGRPLLITLKGKVEAFYR